MTPIPTSPRRLRAVALAALVGSLLLGGCASTPSAPRAPSGVAGPADAWLVAIQSQDWQAMRALLAEAAVYEDPTAAAARGVPLRHEGPDAIVAFWQSSSEDSEAQNIRYRIDERFESGGVTVFTMWLTIEVGGRYWNVDRESLQLAGRQVTSVTVRDGKIVRVSALVDYDAAVRRIDALREEYGPRAPGGDEGQQQPRLLSRGMP